MAKMPSLIINRKWTQMDIKFILKFVFICGDIYFIFLFVVLFNRLKFRQDYLTGVPKIKDVSFFIKDRIPLSQLNGLAI